MQVGDGPGISSAPAAGVQLSLAPGAARPLLERAVRTADPAGRHGPHPAQLGRGACRRGPDARGAELRNLRGALLRGGPRGRPRSARGRDLCLRGRSRACRARRRPRPPGWRVHAARPGPRRAGPPLGRTSPCASRDCSWWRTMRAACAATSGMRPCVSMLRAPPVRLGVMSAVGRRGQASDRGADGRGDRLPRKNSVMSWASRSGSSWAAKCPPRGMCV
jgi:hypothetical protein